jgi:hypothetical protein
MQDAVKVMAKSLVRNRHAVTKMFGLKSQLQAVSLRIAVRARSPARTLHASMALHAREGPCGGLACMAELAGHGGHQCRCLVQ